ncbi:MAG: hypothetical protein BYD32DRAFT_243649 [Podila humilis]|nr:MAG: hypothetical protein BYD32DRAFT_243649 [Podila humilis]
MCLRIKWRVLSSLLLCLNGMKKTKERSMIMKIKEGGKNVNVFFHSYSSSCDKFHRVQFRGGEKVKIMRLQRGGLVFSFIRFYAFAFFHSCPCLTHTCIKTHSEASEGIEHENASKKKNGLTCLTNCPMVMWSLLLLSNL